MIDLASKMAILETLAKANRAADQKDVPGTAACYLEEGYIEGDMQARAGEHFNEDLQQIYDNEPGLKRHVGTGHIFEESGNTVTVKSLLTVFDGEEQPGVVATAAIEDEVRQTDGAWKIARHRVDMDPGTKKAMSGR